MLPRKHYAAKEIEQVLQENEDPTVSTHECGAEESTLRRWKREFPEILSALTSHLCLLGNVTMSLLSTARPLQRLYDTLKMLVHPPPDSSRLAWAFFLNASHPV